MRSAKTHEEKEYHLGCSERLKFRLIIAKSRNYPVFDYAILLAA